MLVKADFNQIAGEVKERNRFYKALEEIKAIALKSSEPQDLEVYKKQIEAILEKCNKVLEGVI